VDTGSALRQVLRHHGCDGARLRRDLVQLVKARVGMLVAPLKQENQRLQTELVAYRAGWEPMRRAAFHAGMCWGHACSEEEMTPAVLEEGLQAWKESAQ